MSKEKTIATDPAFAAASQHWHVLGLTKREYFAAMALQGVLASQTALRGIGACNDESSAKIIALEAVCMADALIEELNKKKP